MTESTTAPERRQHPWLLPTLWIWVGILLVLAFLPVLTSLVRDWMNDDNMGHGFFVPVVAGYIAWQRKEELAGIEVKIHWWGLAVILYAAIQLIVATIGVEYFLARTAFVLSLLGAAYFLHGLTIIRKLAFPFFLLLFMIPIPAIVYNQITLPLQLLASSLAESGLSLLGVPVLREGNILELASQKLSVVEACSGIRSLLSLWFLSLAYGHLFETSAWIRVVLVGSTIPIAIGANAIRVVLTGLISEYDTALAQGVFHTMEGWLIFMISLSTLVLVHRLLTYAVKRVRT
jgi:exosortase